MPETEEGSKTISRRDLLKLLGAAVFGGGGFLAGRATDGEGQQSEPHAIEPNLRNLTEALGKEQIKQIQKFMDECLKPPFQQLSGFDEKEVSVFEEGGEGGQSIVYFRLNRLDLKTAELAKGVYLQCVAFRKPDGKLSEIRLFPNNLRETFGVLPNIDQYIDTSDTGTDPRKKARIAEKDLPTVLGEVFRVKEGLRWLQTVRKTTPDSASYQVEYTSDKQVPDNLLSHKFVYEASSDGAVRVTVTPPSSYP